MSIITRISKLIAISIAVFAIFLLHSKVLKFWYDEAVQLSISHVTDPESLKTYRYAVDPLSVIKWNRTYNMDPGGYSFLLNLLSPAVGNRFYLYRFLSILFFILGVSLVARKVTALHGISTSLIDSLFWSSIAILLLTMIFSISNLSDVLKMSFQSLPLSNLISSGFSIRGYGLQLFLVSALVYASGWYKTYDLKKYLVVAFLLFIGCMVRYDFILFAAAYLLAILINAMLKGEARKVFSFPGTWVIAFFALAGVLTAYKMSYEYQMLTGGAPFILPQLVPNILNNQESILLFFKEFRNIVAIIVLVVIMKRIPKHGICTLEILYVILFAINMVLSFMGMFPFSFVIAKCLSVNLVFDAMLLHLSLLYLRGKQAVLHTVAKSLKILLSRHAQHVAILTIVGSGLIVTRAYISQGEGPLTSVMFNKDFFCFEQTIDSARISTVYMDWWAIPVVNAGFQMKKKKLRPHTYLLGALGSHNKELRRLQDRNKELKAGILRTDCDYYYIPCPDWSGEFRSYMDGRFVRLPCTYSIYRRQ